MLWALHGMVGDPTDWDFLEPHFPLVARQLWSEVDPYDDWARRFCRDVRERDPAPILLGYSMGGRLALHALLEAPDMWRAAVIVSAHTGLADRQSRRIRWLQDDEWARKLRSVSWEVFLKIWNEQAIFAGSVPPGERLTTFKWRKAIIQSFDHWGLSRQEDLLPRLSELPAPVLWMCGAHDPRSLAIGRAAVAALPNGQLEIVPRSGHRVPWEAPDEFVERLKTFIAREVAL
jgi:2-succinyl-6-hydroxy-2,4-cyclohexadiene-1-carboxylate synthase